MAGCWFAVFFSSSSGPSQHSFRRSNPTSSFICSNRRATSGNCRASSSPIPTYWAPCPGKRNATFAMQSVLTSWFLGSND